MVHSAMDELLLLMLMWVRGDEETPLVPKAARFRLHARRRDAAAGAERWAHAGRSFGHSLHNSGCPGTPPGPVNASNVSDAAALPERGKQRPA